MSSGYRLFFSILATAASLSITTAATLRVPDTYATIQAGIDAAVNGDTVLVATGTFTGEGNRGIDTWGKEIVVRSDCGSDSTVIDCGFIRNGFIFTTHENRSTKLDGFAVKNGSDESGGGIYCLQSSPTISDCTLSGNAASAGGGIYCKQSSPSIVNCMIYANSAVDGGGIYCFNASYPMIQNCIISDNTAAEYGGGIGTYWNGNPTVTDCSITGNTVSLHSGGGISIESSAPIINACFISDNFAQMGGGLFYINCRDQGPVISGCTIIANTAEDFGGGICVLTSIGEISNCIISDNIVTDQHGGGVSMFGSYSTVSSCLISGNKALEGDGGGLFFFDYGTPVINSCTISGNTASGEGGGIHCDWHSSPVFNDCDILFNDCPSYIAGGGGVACDGESKPSISRCRIIGNSTGVSGGGIYSEWDAEPWISECLIHGNTADYAGGGIAFYCSDGSITKCTITCNSASENCGGIHIDSSDPPVVNCIIWSNENGQIFKRGSSSPLIVYSDIQGGWPGYGNISEYPGFACIGRRDLRLLGDSPCIDTGNPGEFDPDESRSDMGAYYFDQTKYLTIYMSPDTSEVSQGGSLNILYTVINRNEQPEGFLLNSEVITSEGDTIAVLEAEYYEIPADYSGNARLVHQIPVAAPSGTYQYTSIIGPSPSETYAEDTFFFEVMQVSVVESFLCGRLPSNYAWHGGFMQELEAEMKKRE